MGFVGVPVFKVNYDITHVTFGCPLYVPFVSPSLIIIQREVQGSKFRLRLEGRRY